jgi:hypothetical protein
LFSRSQGDSASPDDPFVSALPKGKAMGLVKKFWLLWVSLGAVVLGFVTLAAGMLTIGPVLLVLGYCVLLPFFLWRSFQDSVGE